MKDKTQWLDKQGNPIDLSAAWKEATEMLPIGRQLTPEQSSRLLAWLQGEAERSALDTRGMAARMLLAYTETANRIPNISSLAIALSNISLTSLNLGGDENVAIFVKDMFNAVMGDDSLETWSVGHKGRRLWRLALTKAGQRTRYKNALRGR